MSFYVYILRCSDGSYYTGHTDDLEKRMAMHGTPRLGSYVSTRLPVHLAWCGEVSTREEALGFERQVKRWSRAKKEALMRGDWHAVSLLAKPISRRPLLAAELAGDVVRQAHHERNGVIRHGYSAD
jgi:predicted GIY-YIG superfamily endonuclease